MPRGVGAAVFAALLVSFGTAGRAEAGILVNIYRGRQTMTVSVDGWQRYTWRVSTGRRSLPTPAGTFHPQSMHVRWFSHKYHHSPMPHSIFFTGGIAIHGTYERRWLGRPVSHGCVRLDPAHAAVLFGLVREEGMKDTTIVVH